MPAPRRIRRHDVAAVVAFGALLALFWTRRLIDARADAVLLGNSDLFLYFLPMHGLLAEALRAGRLPLWNPLQAAGIPFLATQQVGVLYPPHWIEALLPPPAGLAVIVLGHLALALVATYALCRSLGLHPVAAFLGGLAFGLAGPLLFAINFPNALEAIAWFPVGLLALVRLHRCHEEAGRIYPWLVLWAVAEAAPLLAGYVQLWLFVNFVWAAVALGLVLRAAWRGGMGSGARLAAAYGVGGAIGLALTAAQVMPTLELSTDSMRPPAALTWREIAPYGSMPYLAMRNTLRPPRSLNAEYFGVVAVLLAPAALVGTQRFLAAAVAAGGLAVYAMTLGPFTPFYRLYLALPGLAAFRFPDRVRFVALLAVAILAALTVDAVRRESAGPRVRRPVTIAAAAGALAAAALLVHYGASPGLALGAFGVLAVGVAVPAGRVPRLAPAGLVCVLLLDAFLAAKNTLATPWHPAGRQLMGRYLPTLASLVREDPLARVIVFGPGFDPDLAAKGTARAGIYRLDEYDPLVSRRYGLYLDPPRPGVAAPRVAQRFTGMAGAVPRPLLDLAGTRFVVVLAPPLRRDEFAAIVDGMTVRARIPGGQRHATVYDNPRALPRAFVVSRWQVVVDEERALGELVRPGFPLATTAVLEHEPPFAPDPAADERGGAAQILSYEPEDVRIRATASAPSLLVLTDSFAPGWRATVDGVPTPILRADFLFRAVPLGPGTHEVRFTYHPRAFHVGAAISGAAVLALIGAAVVPRRRASAPDEAPPASLDVPQSA